MTVSQLPLLLGFHCNTYSTLRHTKIETDSNIMLHYNFISKTEKTIKIQHYNNPSAEACKNVSMLENRYFVDLMMALNEELIDHQSNYN